MTREEASGVLKAQADYYGKLFESMVTAGDYLEFRELEKRMEALEMGADALRTNPCDNCVGVGLAIAHGYTNMRTNPHQLDSIELDKSTENDVSPTSSPGPQPDPITGLMPCGCGGKASEYFVEHPYVDKGSYVECRWCRINVVGVNKQDARERWNTAMGWRADE